MKERKMARPLTILVGRPRFERGTSGLKARQSNIKRQTNQRVTDTAITLSSRSDPLRTYTQVLRVVQKWSATPFCMGAA
jgi:predicted alpha/beta hydrolase family esterase